MISPRTGSTLFVTLVFLCGLAAGLLVDHLWVAHNQSTALAPSAHASGTSNISMVVKELSLTDDQKHKVEGILDSATRDFDSLHLQAHAVRDRAREEIRAVLNDEQRAKFEASMDKLQKEIAPGQ